MGAPWKYNSSWKTEDILDKFIYYEIPTPAPDGAETEFTLVNAYKSETLEVFRDQLTLQTTVDFTETNPGGKVFTVTSAPDADEVLWCKYQKA